MPLPHISVISQQATAMLAEAQRAHDAATDPAGGAQEAAQALLALARMQTPLAVLKLYLEKAADFIDQD